MTARSAKMLRRIVVAAAMLFVMDGAASAEPFQSGDVINLVVGYEPGGGYDVYGRFVARFLGKHLTNQPRIVVQNMPGAGSLRAANRIYNVAPKDGTTIGILGQSLPLMQLLDTPGILFDVDRFGWLGRVADLDAVLGVWSTVDVHSIEDAKKKEIAIGAGGALSGSELYPVFLNKLIGTKFKMVTGYSGREQHLALQRREIDGSFALVFSHLKVQFPSWLSEGNIRLLLQVGPQRRAYMPEVPTLVELAKNEHDRSILTAISSGDVLGRAFVAPPDTDRGRLAELQRAFDAMAKDPEVLEAAAKQSLHLNFLSGADTQALVHQYKQLSPAVVSSLKSTILEAKRSGK